MLELVRCKMHAKLMLEATLGPQHAADDYDLTHTQSVMRVQAQRS